MAKDKIAFVCSNCGQESAKWMGKCPSCGQWNTFKEIRIAADSGSQAAKNAGMTMRHGGVATMFGGQHSEHDAAPMKLRDISAIDEPRIDMRDEELNRVLGGGMVPGSITHQTNLSPTLTYTTIVPIFPITQSQPCNLLTHR